MPYFAPVNWRIAPSRFGFAGGWLLAGLLLWAAWSPTPREAPTTEEAVADGLRDFVDRNRGL